MRSCLPAAWLQNLHRRKLCIHERKIVVEVRTGPTLGLPEPSVSDILWHGKVSQYRQLGHCILAGLVWFGWVVISVNISIVTVGEGVNVVLLAALGRQALVVKKCPGVDSDIKS